MNDVTAVGWNLFSFCSLPNVYFLMDNTIDSQNCPTLTAECDSKCIHTERVSSIKDFISIIVLDLVDQFLREMSFEIMHE